MAAPAAPVAAVAPAAMPGRCRRRALVVSMGAAAGAGPVVMPGPPAMVAEVSRVTPGLPVAGTVATAGIPGPRVWAGPVVRPGPAGPEAWRAVPAVLVAGCCPVVMAVPVGRVTTRRWIRRRRPVVPVGVVATAGPGVRSAMAVPVVAAEAVRAVFRARTLSGPAGRARSVVPVAPAVSAVTAGPVAGCPVTAATAVPAVRVRPAATAGLALMVLTG